MGRDNELLLVEECPSESEPFKPTLERRDCRILVRGSAAATFVNKSWNTIKFTETRQYAIPVCAPAAERPGKSKEEWFQTIFDASPDGILVGDANKIIFANASCARMLGYKTPEELFGTNFLEILLPDDAARLRKFSENHSRSGERQSSTVYEFKGRRKDGSSVELEASFSISTVDGGTFVVATIRQLCGRKHGTQLVKESEQRLQQSQKMEAIGTLTGGIAHDFNNLLTAIIGNAQLALCKIESGDPLRHRLTEIEKATNRAAVLTRQLLAFSRRQHLERRTINLNDTISEITKLLRRIIGEDIEVSVKCASDLSMVFADPAQIEQVVMNLCVNAREAMPHGGEITIETNNIVLDESYRRRYPYVQPGKYVEITVSDDGRGIDEEAKPRIFEPFFTTKDMGRGSGLGLSIAYGVVKQHGGYINFRSEAGKGTTFKIFLPVDEKAIETERKIVQLPLFGGTETILVAEDEEALRNLAKDTLGRLGYTTLLAKNGEEALEIYAANRERIDLLLFDMVMPRMSGAQAYERIKSLGSDVPLIFMTGYSSDTVQNCFIKQNKPNHNSEAAVIQKPYSVLGLGHKVREILDRRLKFREGV